VDKIFCVSKNTLWRHWTLSGRPPLEKYFPRHRVLYNPVLLEPTEEQLIAARARFRGYLKLPAGAFVLGSVYRPDPGRIDAMLPAVLPRLLKAIPELYFVTRRFPGMLARQAEKILGKRYRNLSITSSQEEMLAFYAGMDALAHFSSMGESFGLAIAEAMRCGVPVVTNETPSLACCNAQAELVADGVTGFLANGPITVINSLQELASSPEKRAQLGQAARQRFNLPELNPQNIARQLESEIIAATAKLGWEIALPQPALAANPSLQEMEEFLLYYSNRIKTPALGSSLRDKLWTRAINFKRFWWKVRRRRLPRE
ncbi:MAG: glycosyltransferase family 4 protein, partial [Planctomycetes bacterium]|nr:glycosyltransferase family 4 protein [Planctomycetota bacterium]